VDVHDERSGRSRSGQCARADHAEASGRRLRDRRVERRRTVATTAARHRRDDRRPQRQSAERPAGVRRGNEPHRRAARRTPRPTRTASSRLASSAGSAAPSSQATARPSPSSRAPASSAAPVKRSLPASSPTTPRRYLSDSGPGRGSISPMSSRCGARAHKLEHTPRNERGATVLARAAGPVQNMQRNGEPQNAGR